MTVNPAAFVYHGFYDEDGIGQVWVEVAQDGPTERETREEVLRKLCVVPAIAEDATFAWSYNGTGASETAAAVLDDALGVMPSRQLYEDFVQDVVMQFPDEWRMRHGAILRWIRGWAAQRQVPSLPPALTNLPAIHLHSWTLDDTDPFTSPGSGPPPLFGPRT
jgi:hypothetical protein